MKTLLFISSNKMLGQGLSAAIQSKSELGFLWAAQLNYPQAIVGVDIFHADVGREISALAEVVYGDGFSVQVCISDLQAEPLCLFGQGILQWLQAGDECGFQTAFAPVLYEDGALSGGGQEMRAGHLSQSYFGRCLPVQSPFIV